MKTYWVIVKYPEDRTLQILPTESEAPPRVGSELVDEFYDRGANIVGVLEGVAEEFVEFLKTIEDNAGGDALTAELLPAFMQAHYEIVRSILVPEPKPAEAEKVSRVIVAE